MTNTTPSSSDSSRNNVIPSEVGWQFVPQYYTHVNKSPQRLHCFYNKTSTFIHGTEGEDGTPCYGQQVGIFARPFLSTRSTFFKGNSQQDHLPWV
jgi:hypothetical protein